MSKTYLMNDGSLVTEKPRLQSRYSYIRPIFVFPEEDKAQQQFKDECDINKIMKRFEKTGILPENLHQAVYGDFSEVPSYLDSLNIVNNAQDLFFSLSSRIRAQFDNDPGQFLNFALDPSNSEELVKMGLATLPATTPEPLPQKVIITNPDALESANTSLPKGKTTPKE